MPIRVTYECSGCWNAKAEGRRFVQRHFDSFNGKGYGFGRYRVDGVDAADILPDGWVAFCPAGATYCPKCWAEIQEACNTRCDGAEGDTRAIDE